MKFAFAKFVNLYCYSSIYLKSHNMAKLGQETNFYPIRSSGVFRGKTGGHELAPGTAFSRYAGAQLRGHVPRAANLVKKEKNKKKFVKNMPPINFFCDMLHKILGGV